jgi:hypothetical protein
LRVESQNGLDGDVDGLEVVFLEHNLEHLFAVGLRGEDLKKKGGGDFRIQRGLGEEDLAIGRVDFEALGEGVVPKVAHVLPVADDAIVDGVRNLQRGAHF